MITYSYKIGDLINNSQILSLFRSNASVDRGDVFVLDDTPINNEDKAIINKYLKSGCVLIADVLSGYSRNLVDSDNITILEPLEFDNDGLIIFRTNMPSTWPESTQTLVENTIKEALENYVLYRISKLKLIESDTYKVEFDFLIGNLRMYVHRRVTTTTRNYNLF